MGRCRSTVSCDRGKALPRGTDSGSISAYEEQHKFQTAQQVQHAISPEVTSTVVAIHHLTT